MSVRWGVEKKKKEPGNNEQLAAIGVLDIRVEGHWIKPEAIITRAF